MTIRRDRFWLMVFGTSLLALFGYCGWVYVPKEIDRALGNKGDLVFEVANGYIFSRTTGAGSGDVHPNRTFSPHEEPCIPAMVTDVAWDRKFVIARQQPIEHKRGRYHYWILDAELPKVHGPLTEQDFASLRTALGVPADLSMRNPDWYRGRKGVREL